MLTTRAICCLLLSTACHATCKDGSATCNMMDEAALLQKEMFLDQAPVDVDKKAPLDMNLISKHISQTISLTVMKDKAAARDKMGKELFAWYLPKSMQITQADDWWGQAEHTKENFKKWKGIVLPILAETAIHVGTELGKAENEEKVHKDILLKALDNMEHEGEFGDKLVRFSTAWGKRKLMEDLKPVAWNAQMAVAGALKEYEEALNKDFVGTNEKVTNGKAMGALVSNSVNLRVQFETWAQVGGIKIKEIDDAAKAFAPHTIKALDDAVWQLVAKVKAEARAEEARQFNDQFKPIGDKILQDTGKYRTSQHSEADFKTWQADVMAGLDKTLSMVNSAVKKDQADQDKDMEEFLVAMDAMEKEEFFADKLTKFTTAWGKVKLGSDLQGVVQFHLGEVENALQAYQKKANGGFDDKAFGQAFAEINKSTMTLFERFGTWTIAGYTKMGELQDGDAAFDEFTKE